MNVETLEKFYCKKYSTKVIVKPSYDPSKGITGDKPSLHKKKSG